MRAAILISFLCVVAYASGEVCQCTSFFKQHISEDHKIHTAPNVDLPSCDDTQKAACKDKCRTVFNKITDNGNISHITSKGITVAELSCQKFGGDIPTDGQLACYYKLCDGTWEFIENTKGKICCKAGKDVPCQ